MVPFVSFLVFMAVIGLMIGQLVPSRRGPPKRSNPGPLLPTRVEPAPAPPPAPPIEAHPDPTDEFERDVTVASVPMEVVAMVEDTEPGPPARVEVAWTDPDLDPNLAWNAERAELVRQRNHAVRAAEQAQRDLNRVAGRLDALEQEAVAARQRAEHWSAERADLQARADRGADAEAALRDLRQHVQEVEAALEAERQTVAGEEPLEEQIAYRDEAIALLTEQAEGLREALWEAENRDTDLARDLRRRAALDARRVAALEDAVTRLDQGTPPSDAHLVELRGLVDALLQARPHGPVDPGHEDDSDDPLREERDSAVARLSDLELVSAELKASRSQLRQRLGELTDQHEALQAAHATLQGRFYDLQKGGGQDRARLAQLDADNHELKRERIALMTRLQDQRAELEALSTAQPAEDARVRQLEEALEAALSERDQARATMDSTWEEVEASTSRIEALEARLVELEASLAQAEGELAQQAQAEESLRSALARRDAELAEAHAAALALQAAVDRQASEDEDTDVGHIQTLRARAAELETALADRQGLLEATAAAREQAREQAARLQSQLSGAVEERARLVETLQSAVATAEERASAAEAAVHQQNDALATLQAELAEAREAARAATQEAQAASALRQQVDTLSAALEEQTLEAEREAEERDDQIGELQGRLGQTTAELQAARAALESESAAHSERAQAAERAAAQAERAAAEAQGRLEAAETERDRRGRVLEALRADRLELIASLREVTEERDRLEEADPSAELRATLTEVRQELALAREMRDVAQQDRAALQQQAAALQARIDTLQHQRDEARAAVDAHAAQQAARASEAQREVRALQDVRDRLEEQAAKDRAALEHAVAEASSAEDRLRSEHDTVRARLDELEADYEALQAELARAESEREALLADLHEATETSQESRAQLRRQMDLERRYSERVLQLEQEVAQLRGGRSTRSLDWGRREPLWDDAKP